MENILKIDKIEKYYGNNGSTDLFTLSNISYSYIDTACATKSRIIVRLYARVARGAIK